MLQYTWCSTSVVLGGGGAHHLGIRSVYLLDYISPDDSLLMGLCYQLGPAGVIPQIYPISLEGNLNTDGREYVMVWV